MDQVTVWPHYKVTKLDGMKDVRKVFEGETDFTLNWLFLSTSGVHGSYATLDEVFGEEYLNEDGSASITAMVMMPRLVVMRYGEIRITQADVPFLRETVRKTMEGIAESQKGNT
jgi:hypothetical protein